ncbi:uncharacterized protein LOC136071752 [Hydra vulgaris]|uniref:uncharacterized protein LOC136071752 n=1 Tax=Hydra vulgaris TaxID=6087 RepID=UPI0032EA51C4
MIWARAVWIENYEEIEDVVPRKWIDTEKKLLFWPAGVSYRRAVKEEMDVDETCNKYKLIKIKFESDNIEELKEYCYTTAAEEEDVVDICVSKSAFKLKTLNKQPQSNIAIKQLETIAEFEDFNKSLVDDCVRLDLVKQLSFLYAEDFKQLTRLVMNRLFTNTLLTQFNLKGSGGKIGLHSTKLFDVIEEVVKRRFEKVSNAEIKEQNCRDVL